MRDVEAKTRIDLSPGCWIEVRRLRWRDEVDVRATLPDPPAEADKDGLRRWNLDYTAACVAACVLGFEGWAGPPPACKVVESLSVVEFAKVRAAVFGEADGLKNSEPSSGPGSGA